MSLNVSYHKEQQYIWLRGGISMVSEMMWGISPAGPTAGVNECVLS